MVFEMNVLDDSEMVHTHTILTLSYYQHVRHTSLNRKVSGTWHTQNIIFKLDPSTNYSIMNMLQI